MKYIIFLFLFYTITITGQVNYESGYFVDNEGVRTDCLINNKDWYVSPNSFKYKLTTSSKVEEANISDVSEFRILKSDGFYIRYKLDENLKLKSSEIIKRSNDLIFLKILVEGNTRLLSYQNNGDVFFYQSKGKEIVKLEYYEYLEKIDNKTRIIKKKDYQEQLFKELKCQSFQISTFTNLEYSLKDLVDVFEAYNECNSFQYVNVSDNRTKINLQLSLNLGYTVVPNSEISFTQTYRTSSGGFSYPTDFDVTYSSEVNGSIVLGFELEMLLPFRKNKWGVFIAPNYQKYSQSSKTIVVTDIYNGYSFTNPIVFSVDYAVLELPIGVKYYMKLNKNSKLHLSFNYSFLTILNKSSSESLDVDYLDNTYNFSSFTITSKESSEKNQNLAFGIGYNLMNKYSVAFNYNLIKQLNGNADFSSDMDGTMSLILGYRLL